MPTDFSMALDRSKRQRHFSIHAGIFMELLVSSASWTYASFTAVLQ